MLFFLFFYIFPVIFGWMGGRVGIEIEMNANSTQPPTGLELELGLSLAKISICNS